MRSGAARRVSPSGPADRGHAVQLPIPRLRLRRQAMRVCQWPNSPIRDHMEMHRSAPRRARLWRSTPLGHPLSSGRARVQLRPLRNQRRHLRGMPRRLDGPRWGLSTDALPADSTGAAEPARAAGRAAAVWPSHAADALRQCRGCLRVRNEQRGCLRHACSLHTREAQPPHGIGGVRAGWATGAAAAHRSGRRESIVWDLGCIGLSRVVRHGTARGELPWGAGVL
jgi:hypothetical protein